MAVAEFHTGELVERTCRACGADFSFAKGSGGPHRTRCDECKRLARRLHERGYQITVEEFWQMHRAQNGLCAICKQPETVKGNHNHKPGPRRLAIDHCHETEIVRGLLCGRCNTAIGLLGDDPARVEAAARYLRSSAAPLV